MGRRGNGARLKYREDRNAYYIYYTDAQGCTRQRSTGTDDLKEAELVKAKFDIMNSP